MTTPYIAQQTVNDFGHRFSDLKWSVALSATTDTTVTIPGKAARYKAVMTTQPNGVVWVANNAAAAAPAGTTLVPTTSELLSGANVLCREVDKGDVLHFFTATATTVVSIVLYPIGTPN